MLLVRGVDPEPAAGGGSLSLPNGTTSRERAPNLYYRWSKEFLEADKKRLLGNATREATSTEVQDLRRENSQLKQVVAEAVLENRVLKKIWWSPVRGTIRATDRGREARGGGEGRCAGRRCRPGRIRGRDGFGSVSLAVLPLRSRIPELRGLAQPAAVDRQHLAEDIGQ